MRDERGRRMPWISESLEDAAEDLLAACRAVQRQHGLCWCLTWHQQGNMGECPDCVTRDAIRKAEGGSL